VTVESWGLLLVSVKIAVVLSSSIGLDCHKIGRAVVGRFCGFMDKQIAFFRENTYKRMGRKRPERYLKET